MHLILLLAVLTLASGCVTYPASYQTILPPARDALYEYPYFDDQVTGIAVSQQGRIFVNFPRWGKDPRYSVAEVLPDGTLRPYPDIGWNRWGKSEAGHPEAHFICVQSVFVDDDDFLWILDAASPSFKGVVPHGAKLLKVNLATDALEQVMPFDSSAVFPNSYLNDIRIDPVDDFAYITDSGAGAILVVDLENRKSRRLLAEDPSTKAEPGYVPVIEGRELRNEKGQAPQIHADGIAIDSDGDYLYYHALTARTLYRIRTSILKDPALSGKSVADNVERLAVTGAVDGMVMDEEDNLYFTALEENAVKCYRQNGKIENIVRADQLQWPDSLSISPDDYLYITASQIHRMPRFNNGRDRRVLPYKFFKIWLAPP